MASLPTGTVTFLFTDIEGSTRLLQDLGDRYPEVLADCRRLIRTAFEERSGHEIDAQGDAFFIAFPRAKDALLAAVSAQRKIVRHPWPEGSSVRVRMGLHTGEPLSAATGYVGMDLHRAARICAAGHGGQILVSEATSALATEDLSPDLSLRDLGQHRLKDLARPERIFQIVAADLPAEFPPLKSLDTLPNNLPRYLTSFIGREREINEVKRLLSGTCLLTLTGPGGVGKTHLALRLAADVLGAHPEGVWLVELASLKDASLIPQTIATALGVREQPGRSLLTTLTDYLRPKELLLILDNCEHLIAACARLTDSLLRACPKVKVLATSREPLGIAGETVWSVPSLSLPDLRRLPPTEQLAEYEAVRLFTERAKAVLPMFSVTDQNARAVAHVCNRLDGIPLGIELAATRVKVLAVEQIASRLDDRFRLLTRGSRTALPRHQTLQAAIDWSYELLSERERAVFRGLSVFAGGWTLEAAEAVCAWEGARELDVLDLLSQLVAKSLLLVEPRGAEVRYWLLETIREYGEERLRAVGEEPVMRRRHRDWYLRLAEQSEQAVRGPDQVAWVERLDAEHDNLRAALEFCKAEKENAGHGLRLAGALWPFWEIRGHMSEGRRRLTEALDTAGAAADPAVRAKALTGAGVLAYRLGDHAAARAFHEESLAISRVTGDRAAIAASLNNLGNVARDLGEFAAANSFYEKSLQLRRALDDSQGIAYTLNNLGNVARAQGDHAAAQSLFEEALALLRRLGDKHAIGTVLANLGFAMWEQGDLDPARTFLEQALAIDRELADKAGIGGTLSKLGLVASMQGDHASAQALFEESLTMLREVGDRRGVAYTLGNLAENVHRQGDDVTARALLQESLTTQREVGDKRGIAYSLERFGGLAAANGLHGRAARLFGAAEALRELINAPLSPAERAEYEHQVSTVRTALTPSVLEAAWGQGRILTLEEAIEYALSDHGD